jgi:histidinol phosphatase-like PHP family hydrolase
MNLFDCHCHSELAYCRDDVTAEAVVARARQAGLAGVCITEHGPQLYCSADDFWDARHLIEPALWQNPSASRIGAYRELAGRVRRDGAGFVRVGLEVELDFAGQMTLRAEDRDWPDLLIGALHFRPEEITAGPRRQRHEWFLETCSTLLHHGVDILAHPFRIFARFEESHEHLYAPLAELLAETNTAAEINFHHTSRPDAGFLAACIERGVKLSLGSDAHSVEVVGQFDRHLAVLREAAGREDIAELLYEPPPAGR